MFVFMFMFVFMLVSVFMFVSVFMLMFVFVFVFMFMFMFMRILMLMLSSCSIIPLVIPYAKHPLEISPAAKHPLEISPILPMHLLTLIIACTPTSMKLGERTKRSVRAPPHRAQLVNSWWTTRPPPPPPSPPSHPSAPQPSSAPSRPPPFASVGLLALGSMQSSFWLGTTLSAFAHPKLGHHVLQSVQEADECAGWLNGSLDTYHDAHTRSWSPGGYTSQFRQDKILFNTLFRNRTNRGIYLDIASNHYKRISNSYFYDRCLGWQGVCVGAG